MELKCANKTLNESCMFCFLKNHFTISRAISAGHAAAETRKHACEILQTQSAADLQKIIKNRKAHHEAPNEKSKDIIKKCKFCNGCRPRV